MADNFWKESGMIKKLKIKNFKSLRDVEIELGKFTVLIGPNASGKSNLLDSLLFLSQTAGIDLSNSLNQRGKFEHIAFAGKGEKFEIAIEFLLDNQASNYLLCVNKGGNVEQEKLVVGDKVVIQRELGGQGSLLRDDGTVIKGSWSQNQTVIYSVGRNEHFPLVQNAYDYLRSWKLYQIITSEIRKTFPAQRRFDLQRTGGNLAQVLISLHNERPKVFRVVEEILKLAIPEIEELLTPLTAGGETLVAIREKGFEQEFDYYQVSDGTLKLLTYITAISLSEPRLICFEEPENFIHPELLELLVELLKKSEKQILLSTHSPYFVNFVEPEDIRLIKKEGGETKVSKIQDPEKLRDALEEMGLGELWYSGEFGGVP